MIPEDYLQRYTEPLQLVDSISASPIVEAGSMLQGYYYPPSLRFETYLDNLNRTDLLEIMEQVLSTEYPQQRFVRRQVSEYLSALQELKDERAWRQAEMERLDMELARCRCDCANLEREQKRLETLVYKYQAELDNCQKNYQDLGKQCAMLQATVSDLYASTSWKVTMPLRFISKVVKDNLLRIK
ncbi:MAG: hypothetical protein P9E24_13305 [Candidatus Competibacter sp.]|nr:hypothetical protein [Candidatus Competibacter sp.]MDG4582731.1 hypothetical protein [Candidatus Competibacter sp.]